MTSWNLVYTKQAQKDAKKMVAAGLKPQAEKLLGILKGNLLKNPPAYEKLIGDLQGSYSRRINIQHRLIYQVYVKEKIVKVICLWSHYE